VGINKGVQREIFIQLIDIAAQSQVVFIPVKITPQIRGLCSINFSRSALFCGQIAESRWTAGPASSSLIGSSL
jgi:hypothetical protein